jgi:multisubunit Na+/H+ antiporter MnhB subunit
MRESFRIRLITAALAALPGFLFIRAFDFALFTLRWPLSISPDAMVNRTGAWLLIQGVWPYRDFNDINLPGTYFLHFLGLRIFGYSDTAFRLQDMAWNALTAVCVFYFLRKYGRFAAWLGAGLTLAIHCEATPFGAFQRESLIFLFWILAAFLYDRFADRGRENQRLNVTLWSIVGLLAAFSTLIKPTSVFFFLTLALYHTFVVFRRSGDQVVSPRTGLRILVENCIAAIMGVALLCAIVAFVLYRNDALLSAFHVISQEYRGYVVEFENRTKWQLFSELFALSPGYWNIPLSFPVARPGNIGHFGIFHAGLLVLWCFTAVRQKWTMMPAALFVAGLFSYLVQGKGFQYHLYPVWHSLNIMTAMIAGFLVTSILPAAWRSQMRNWLPEMNSRTMLRPAAVTVLAAVALFLITKDSLARRMYFGTGLTERYSAHAIPNWKIVRYSQNLEARIRTVSEAAGSKLRMLHIDGSFVAMNMLMQGNMLPASRFLSDHLLWADTTLGSEARASFLDQIHASRPQLVVYRFCGQCFRGNSALPSFPRVLHMASRELRAARSSGRNQRSCVSGLC